MPLALSDVQQLADLARIELVDDEAESILVQLNRLFALIDQIQQVKTNHIPPLTHPIELAHPIDSETDSAALYLREDKVTEIVPRDQYQRIAAATENGLYLVPKVVE